MIVKVYRMYEPFLFAIQYNMTISIQTDSLCLTPNTTKKLNARRIMR